MRQNSNTSSEHRNISLLRVFGQLLPPFPGYKLFATLLHGVEFLFLSSVCCCSRTCSRSFILCRFLFPVYRPRQNGPEKGHHWIAPPNISSVIFSFRIVASHHLYNFYHHLIIRLGTWHSDNKFFTSILMRHPFKLLPINKSISSLLYLLNQEIVGMEKGKGKGNMSIGGYGQPAYGVKNQIILSLCIIAGCLETVILSPGKEPISQILLSFSLVTAYALAMVSIFAPSMTTRGLAARLSVVSATISVALMVTRELACKVQTCHCPNGA